MTVSPMAVVAVRSKGGEEPAKDRGRDEELQTNEHVLAYSCSRDSP